MTSLSERFFIKCQWISLGDWKSQFVIQWQWNVARFSNKTKNMQWCIQFLCAEKLSEEEPPESYDRKLNTVENGRNNEVDDTEKSSDEGQDIHLQIDSKKGYNILSFKSS